MNDKLEHVITDTPRLSLGMLMTWEAICFACDKFDRDQEAALTLDREAEIMSWASRYLRENHWPVPPLDVLVTFLEMRDHIDLRRIVGKFS